MVSSNFAEEISLASFMASIGVYSLPSSIFSR